MVETATKDDAYQSMAKYKLLGGETYELDKTNNAFAGTGPPTAPLQRCDCRDRYQGYGYWQVP